MKTAVIDNYDSFTYNLVQLLGKFTGDITVFRNDRVTVTELREGVYDGIVISPGPGRPEDSGVSLEVIDKIGKEKPVLGVCLGCQGIGHVFGAEVIKADYLMHGKTSEIQHDGRSIYRNVPQNFTAARYHSLVIKPESLPDVLEVSGRTEDGLIMSVRHKDYPIEGIQYHPESFITTEGFSLIKNWVSEL